MRSLKWKSLLALLFTFSLVAAACGSDDDAADTVVDDTTTTTTAAPTTTEAPATTEATPDEPLVVTLLGPETGADADAINATFAAFTEATGIVVDYTGTADATPELNVALEAGTPPDLAVIPQPGRTLGFAADGSAIELPTSVTDIVAEQYDPFWAELVTYQGGVYGVPNKGDVKSLVWYSPTVFADNGYEIPSTWAEFEQLLADIQANGQTPLCVGIESGGATGWPFTDWMEDVMLRLKGPDVYDQWVNHEISFDDPAVKDVAEFVGDLWFKDGNVLGGRDTIASTNFKDAGLALANGDCVLHRQANFAGGWFTDIGLELGPDGDLNVFYLPTISDEFGNVVLGAGTHVVAFSDRPEVIQVLEWIADAEYANTRIEGDFGGFLSPNKTHDTSLYSSSFDQVLAQILVSADPFRFDGSDLMPGEVGAGEFWSAGTDFVSGAIDVDEFLARTEAAWP